MRVVITGGSGFIGRALSASLAGKGHEVVHVSRQTRTGGEYASVAWRDLARVVDGAWAVVNLAGENIAGGRWTPERKRSILESRVRAGQAVTEAVAQAVRKPQVVAQASAVGWYGHTGLRRVDEVEPAGRNFLAEVCRAWEPSSAAVEGQEVRRVVFRSGLVLDGAGGLLATMLPAFRLGLGARLGDGRQGMSWVALDDEVRGIEFLLTTPETSGVYNLCAPNPVDNATFGRSLARVLGRPFLLAAPASVLRLALGEMAENLLLAGQLALPRRLTEAGFTFAYPELPQALRAGLDPV